MACLCYAHLHSLSKLFAGISLQPMLQELSKQNPQLLRLIQENNDEFLQLLNETFEGGDGYVSYLLNLYIVSFKYAIEFMVLILLS